MRYEVYGSIDGDKNGKLVADRLSYSEAMRKLAEIRREFAVVWIYDTKEGQTILKERRGTD